MRHTTALSLLAGTMAAIGLTSTLAPASGATAPTPPKLLSDQQVGAQSIPDLRFADLTPSGEIVVSQDAAAADTNPGTWARPVRTIGQALRLVKAGQAIRVRTGRYAENLRPTTAGTAATPIWLTAAPGEKPVLIRTAASTQPVLRLGQPYWTVRGLDIDAAGAPSHGVRVEATDHVVLDGVSVHGASGPAGVAFVDAKQSGVRNSRIYDNKGATSETHGVFVIGASTSLLISGNDSWGNSGDSVQCAGTGQTGYGTADPTDLTVQGNRYGNLHRDGTPRAADRENAVDIKSCQRVSIRGNKMMGYRGVDTSPQGSALVAHYGADKVLIEGNRIWDSNSAASLGSATNNGLGSVVFRRNLVFSLKQAGTQTGKGAFGLRVGPAREVEVYANTFYDVPGDQAPTTTNFAIWIGDDGPVGRAVVVDNIVDGKDPQWRADPIVNDFYTRDTSPARDTALIPGTSYCGSKPDIGFLESC